MATATATGMTAEEFREWGSRPENAGKRCELVEGELIAMSPPGRPHALVCWFLVKLLTEYLTRHGSGHLLTNDGGISVARNPDTVRGPDIALFLTDLALDLVRPGPCVDVPQLIVEVRSPSDRDRAILRRVRDYHQMGVPLVWVVDYEDRFVTSYRPNEFPAVRDEAETLDGNGVLPNFLCTVADLFRSGGYPTRVTP